MVVLGGFFLVVGTIVFATKGPADGALIGVAGGLVCFALAGVFEGRYRRDG